MSRLNQGTLIVASLILAAALQAAAVEVILNQVTFPERRSVDLSFAATSQAPAAKLEATVKHEEGQAAIKLKFRDMKPAILYGGDVTSYVLWAVSREGGFENLGELWVRTADDELEFATGMKSFALLVTAEAYPLVNAPSELVMFTSQASEDKKSPTTPFSFSAFAPAPPIGMESIANIAWDSSKPLDLLQAEKAFELAEREGAAEYVPQIYREAKIALGQAQAYGTNTTRTKAILDFSRRAVSLASEAIAGSIRRKEAIELERQIEERRREMEAIQAKAASAEAAATEAQQGLIRAQAEALAQQRAAEASLAEARLKLEQAQGEANAQQQAAAAAMARSRDDLDRLESQRTSLEQQQAELQSSVAQLGAEAEKLRAERAQLASRLEGALSKVAETQSSARGLIVNLPDILFATNEATLKAEAREVIAKLSGILLIMPELNLRVEGHTDSTGGDEYNQRLSERRAASVRDFLVTNGIEMGRIVAAGYGKTRPRADNASAEGRQKNRRVEIVIAQGQVQEAPPPTP